MTLAGAFAPDLVIVKERAADLSMWRCSAHVGDKTAYFSSGTADAANLIQSFTSTGFTVGDDASVNQNTKIYDYQAFRITGPTDMAVGVYAGDDANPRTIAVGLTPVIVLLKQDGTNNARWRIAHNAANEALRFDAAADSNVITGFTASGFTITNSSAVNASGSNYNWVAFAVASGFIAEGAYTGNATDPTSIAVGFQPDLVWVKQTGAVSAVYHPSTREGDVTSYFTATSSLADAIQAFEANGFQIGGHATVNTNLVVYRWAAWKVGTSTVTQYDETGRSQTLLLVSGSAQAQGYVNTGMSQSIKVLSSLADWQRYVDTGGVTLKLSSLLGDTQAYTDAKTAAILVTPARSDSQIYTNAATQALAMSMSRRDWQQYTDSGLQALLVSQSQLDTFAGGAILEELSQVLTILANGGGWQGYADALSQVVTVVPAGKETQKYVERILSQTLKMVPTTRDWQQYTDTNAQTVKVAATLTDIQAYANWALQTLLMVPSARDVQTYSDATAIVLKILTGMADAQTYVERLAQSILVSQASVDWQAYCEAKNQLLLVGQTGADTQAYIEYLVQSLLIGEVRTDTQTYVDAAAQSLLMALAETDTFSGIIVQILETLSQTLAMLVTGGESQAYTNLAPYALAVLATTDDGQAYADSGAQTVKITQAVSDIQQLILTLWRRLLRLSENPLRALALHGGVRRREVSTNARRAGALSHLSHTVALYDVDTDVELTPDA